MPSLDILKIPYEFEGNGDKLSFDFVIKQYNKHGLENDINYEWNKIVG